MDMSILWKLSYGMYAIGAEDFGRPVGCIVNTISQITSTNPIIAVSMNKDNYTNDIIARTKRFSVSILSEAIDPTIISKLGFFSGKEYDKFDDVAHTLVGGTPIVKEDCCGYLICDVIDVTDCETHCIILARVVDTIDGVTTPAMTYQYYHTVIKGKAPKNAPTYRADSPTSSDNYVCEICGYVHEGDIAKEPEDYTCPLCKAPKALFSKAIANT